LSDLNLTNREGGAGVECRFRVYAPLILEPEEALAKAHLADLIGEAIEHLGLTQVQAGELLGNRD